MTWSACFKRLSITALLTTFPVLRGQQPLPPGQTMPSVLYGAAYYNEYMPAALQPAGSKKTLP